MRSPAPCRVLIPLAEPFPSTRSSSSAAPRSLPRPGRLELSWIAVAGEQQGRTAPGRPAGAGRLAALGPHPSGLDGFGLGLVAAAVNDLPIAEGHHLPGPALNLGAGPLAASPLMEANHDRIARVDRLFGLEAEIIEPLGPLAKELSDLRRAVIGSD